MDVNRAVIREQFSEENQALAQEFEVVRALQQIRVGVRLTPRLEHAFGRVRRVNIDQPDMTTNCGVANQSRKDWQIVTVVKPVGGCLAVLFRPELAALRRGCAKNFWFGFFAFVAQMHVSISRGQTIDVNVVCRALPFGSGNSCGHGEPPYDKSHSRVMRSDTMRSVATRIFPGWLFSSFA